MTNYEIFLNSEYHHDKTNNNYQTLILSNSDKPQQVVYVNEQGEVWSKNIDRFLQGMSFVKQNTDNHYSKKDIPDNFPQIGDFYYNKETDLTEKASPASSVLYITNLASDKDDYPITVFFLSNGIIDYMTLEQFYSNFTK